MISVKYLREEKPYEKERPFGVDRPDRGFDSNHSSRLSGSFGAEQPNGCRRWRARGYC